MNLERSYPPLESPESHFPHEVERLTDSQFTLCTNMENELTLNTTFSETLLT